MVEVNHPSNAMGSPIKINSISIDLADAANEIDRAKCDHFTIRGLVVETRTRDPRKCWPFPKESPSLVDQQQEYSLPALTVQKYRWWRCSSCTNGIDNNVDATKDGGHSNSKTTSENENLSVIASKRKLKPQTEKERKGEIAGNDVADDKDVATTLLKKVRPRSMDASTVKSKRRKLSSHSASKRSKEKVSTDKETMEQAVANVVGSSDIAGVIEDTPPNENDKDERGRVPLECDNNVPSESREVNMSRSQRRRIRKVRYLSELLSKVNTKTNGGESSDNNIRKEDSASRKESVRGRKRKLLSTEDSYVSRNLSIIRTTSENASEGLSESDSGLDRNPIIGKQKNRRFQVVDEFVPSLPCETSQEGVRDAGKAALSSPVRKDSVPTPLSIEGTEKKLSLGKKKKKKKTTVVDNRKSSMIGFKAGMEVNSRNGPPVNAVSPTTREKRLDNRLDSEGYVRKHILEANNDKPDLASDLPDNANASSRLVEANGFRDFGSSSKSNAERMRTGAEVVDLSSAAQKDGSGGEGKEKTVTVQEHQGVTGSQSQNTTPDEQNDDIPMEIVELMAKNQYERCLPDKEEDVTNKHPPQETAPKSKKKALLIDLNETYEDNNNNNAPRQPILPSDNNARKDEHFPIRKQQTSPEFPPRTQPFVPPPPPPPRPQFGIFPPPTTSQENRASSFRFPAQNSQWLGSMPTMANQNPNPNPNPYRVLQPCNTFQSVPPQYRAASHPYWPPSAIPPHGYHNPGMFSQPSSNENAWNLNFNGKQKCGSGSECSFACNGHAAGVSSSVRRPMDTYSSESSIPAMHLLSLMDPRPRSNAPPAEHQGNTNFTRRHFPPVNQANELPYGFYDKRFAPETSRRSFPMGPPLGTSSFPFQNAETPWNHTRYDKRQDIVAPVFGSNNNNNNGQGRFQILGASNSMMLPLQQSQKRREGESSARARPIKNGSEPLPECVVNRNPADFTVPGPENVYMLSSENLKVRTRAATFKRKQNLSKQTR